MGMLMVSFVLAGCGGGESTATPDNLDAAREAAKKLQQREAAAKQKSPSDAKGEANAPKSGRKK
ncbi:MAG: hypothetical protein ACLQGP_32605 [Isosphaeraceae bacterium]